MSARKSAGVVKCPGLLTVRQAAEYLATTPATIYTRIWRREIPFIKIWGWYPDQDHGKAVSDIASVMDSPTRLPAVFANELYRAGESGMGYCLFTVIFKSDNSSVESSQAYVTGDAVDFIDYPEGKGPKDVVRVLPHIGRESNHINGPKYYWCLYSE